MNPRHRGQKGIPKEEVRHDNVPTPLWLIDKMLDWAGVKQDSTLSIVDPCCGDNRILWCAERRGKGPFVQRLGIDRDDRSMDANQIFGELSQVIFKKSFFAMEPTHGKFDRAILNPPYSNNGSTRFTEELLKTWIKPDGRIISVVPAYFLDNSEHRKRWLARHLWRVAWIPKDTFTPEVPVLHGAIVDIRPAINPNPMFVFRPEQNYNLEATA